MGANVIPLDIRATVTNATKQGADSVKKDVESLKKNIEKDLQKSGASDLLKSFGGDKIMSAFVGGAVVAGVGLIARELSNATNKLREFTDLYRQGETDAAGMAIAIGKSIPIIGDAISAGQNLREIFTGEKFQLEMQEKYIRQINTAQESVYRTAIQLRDVRRDEGELVRRMARDISGIGVRGLPKIEHDIESRRLAAKAEAERARQVAIAEAGDNPALKAAQEALRQFNEDAGGGGRRLEQLESDKLLRFLDAAGVAPGKNKDLDELMELRDRQSRLQATVRNAGRNVQGVKGEKIRAAEERARLADEEAKKASAEARRVDQETRQTEGARSGERVTQNEQAAMQAKLKRIGEVRKAEIAALQDRGRAEQAAIAIQAEADIRQTDDQARKKEIADRAAAERLAIQKRTEDEIATVQRDHQVEAARAEFDANEARKAAAEAAAQERLRIEGRGGEAELAVIRETAERKKREINKQLELDLAKDNRDAEARRARAKAQKDAIDAETATATRRQIEANRQAGVGVEQTIGGAEIKGLRNRARLGDFAAASEATAREIKQQFAAQRAELEGIIHNEQANPAQRARAARELAGIDQQEAGAMTAAGLRGAAGMSSYTGAGRTSGASQRFAETNSVFVQLIRSQESATEAAKRQASETAEMRKLLENAPPIRVLLKGK